MSKLKFFRLVGHTKGVAPIIMRLFIPTFLICFAAIVGIIDIAYGQQQFIDETESRLPIVQGRYSASDVGDIEGDGDLDIVVGSYQSTLQILVNNGNGFFEDETSLRLLSIGEIHIYDLAFGDVDGDNDLDILLGGNFGLNQERLLINNGNGFFADETDIRLPLDPGPFTGDRTNGVEFGDVDNDGDLDIIKANMGVGQGTPGDQNRLLINNGMGVFTDETSDRLPDIIDNSGDAKFGDVDNDGDLDIFVANNFYDYTPGVPGEQDRLLINDGSGIFTDETAERLPSDSGHGNDADFGDVDGDGDLDIIVSNGAIPLPEQNYLLINNGTGRFNDETSLRLPFLAKDTADSDFGDVDGDGDLDIYSGTITTTGGGDGRDRLLINNGDGIFSDETSARLPFNWGGTADSHFGDWDGDGDLDIFVAVEFGGQSRLLINHFLMKHVRIDIKPGSDPNSINLGSGGTVPVAILGTVDLDATTIDPTTITLASAPVKLKGKGTPMSSFEDVNGDGLLDLIVHIETEALELSETDKEAILEGKTYNGTFIKGVDTVRIVP